MAARLSAVAERRVSPTYFARLPTGGPADRIRTYDLIADEVTDHRLRISLPGALDPANLTRLNELRRRDRTSRPVPGKRGKPNRLTDSGIREVVDRIVEWLECWRAVASARAGIERWEMGRGMGLLGGVFGLSREKFAKQALAAVRGSRDIVDAEFVADHYGIVFDHAGGESALIELEPYYARAVAVDRSGRERILGSLTAALRPLVSRPRTFSEAAPALRSVVRRVGYGWVPDIAPGQRPVSRPLLPHLAEMLVLDRPTTMSYVSVDVLAGWGVSADEAFTVARQNLAEQGREFLAGFTAETPVLEQVFDGEGGLHYAASMPLIPGWMSALGDRLGGRPIVFLLEQTGLVIADDTAPLDLPHLLDMSEDIYSRAERPISPLPYTLDERGELTPYDVPADAPGWDELRYAERVLARAVHEDQADLIRESQTTASDLAEYPAPLLHWELSDGSLSTVATWTDGVETLLPKADLVSLQTRDLSTIPWYTAEIEDSFTIPWDVLDEVIDLSPAEGFDPPRYRVGPAHPAADALARLRTEDIENE